jgi:hypothetical protein
MDDAERAELIARVLTVWADYDAARALHTVDAEVIPSTEAARSLVLELFAPTAPARDFFTACARLGGLMAEAGASPSLAAGVIDSAIRAFDDVNALYYDRSRTVAGRASLVEGYVAAVRDTEREAALGTWEWPRCVVPLEDGAVAIACGYPADDGALIAAWAARVAGRVSKNGIKRVTLSGPERVTAEVSSALTLVGVEIVEREQPTKARRWFRLPWRSQR